ncbi:hypothetical protein [Singulisphaera sp. PoT]|uniref:hypothetical protein n=1 Tax=Singulisphaera sp. PoT TaxID=3411797 RepID=UPI003BF49373
MSHTTWSRPRQCIFGLSAMILAIAAIGVHAAPPSKIPADWIWVEGESTRSSTMNRHPWWYDKVKRDQLSGGDLISKFDDDKAGEGGFIVADGSRFIRSKTKDRPSSLDEGRGPPATSTHRDQ